MADIVKGLTKRQRQILLLMHEHGPAVFSGGTRKFWYVLTDVVVSIHAYCNPEYFLAARNLIAESPMNMPGKWYRLTTEGQRRAEAIKP